ncbi:hypothetical protein B0T17DRAFT_532983 [Bombardia bombarda]|uniref:NAD(P)-binding domain-containing protein n=1 Tax=Bombardia bombarda TaxID=252184 RepID=A0AA39X1H0_9PEZI|nr:hypothetical protein B0T17DRAFT_532983 [Bombardia bombarda]
MSPPHHVLLLGGHGKVAQLLTPLLLRRSWAVTSVIRNPDQVAELDSLRPADDGKGATIGPLNVLVRSIEEVKSEAQAKAIIDEVKPDYVVFSAGAAGKGGAERTFAIDRDAAIHFINAAAATPSVTRFLLVSYLACRRQAPSWWSSESWEAADKVNKAQYPTYYQAKIAADEALYTASKNRSDFIGINVRPGTLTAEPAAKVELGKTRHSRGATSRETVAKVADGLLASEGIKNTWLDLVDGDEDINAAVKRVVDEGVNCAEGEPVF